MIVQTVKFPVITTMTRTERTVAQVIAIVSGTDRMDIFYDGPPRKAKKKITNIQMDWTVNNYLWSVRFFLA